MMKRWMSLVSVLSASMYLGAMPLAAQGRGHGVGGTGQMGRPSMESRGDSSRSGEGREVGGHERAGHGGVESSVSERLADNTRLASKLSSLLPAGTKVQDAAHGFRNLGQFVAAVHLSHNLDIPFDQLKPEVLSKGSLGKAVHALKPDLSKKQVKEATGAAEKEAKQDVGSSERKTA